MKKKKFIAFSEMILILVSLFAFSHFVSTDSLPLVSAEEGFKGCCLETKEGAICQDIPSFQADLCKDSLIGTSCSVVDQCKVGCCYSPSTGTCALKSPKDKCLQNGGNWSNDASCNIPECQLGCCVLGDQVSLTNSRECTLLSNKYNFEKKFVQVGAGESCDQYTGLEQQGACLTDSGDFSGEKKCTFTTKKSCKSGDFRPGYLCTSQELNTVCEKSKKTTCVDGKDQVYFLDSCGNLANVYDASKVEDQSYWEKPIDPKDSCSPENPNCGNCNYIEGSICVQHEQGKTTKPTYGDYTCKSLHCGERKHGESWCVYDFAPGEGVAPVGSRHFVANCFEGQISIEGCADFNQEICAQSTDTSFGFTEAKCLVNDWRSCINSNDAGSYQEVKSSCDENPQCVMFNDFYGEDNLKRSDGEFLAGFNPDKSNAEQGASGELGKDQNQVLAHCVPRFTPGFQFWTTSMSLGTQTSSKSSASKQTSTASYGGSETETNAICSLGSFTCVSKKQRECELGSGSSPFDPAGASCVVSSFYDTTCDPWYDVDNWECNIDGVTTTINTTDLPVLMAAMNERCRALGTCGVSTNLKGKVNSENATIGFTISRIKIDKTGNQKEISSEGYALSEDYISSLKKSTPSLTKLDQIKANTGDLIAGDADTAGTTGSPARGVIDWNEMARLAEFESATSSKLDFYNVAGPLSALAIMIIPKGGAAAVSTSALGPGNYLAAQRGMGGYSYGATPPPGSPLASKPTSGGGLAGLKAGATMAVASIVGAYAGAQLGGLIVKNNPHWSAGQAREFLELMGAAGSAIAVAIAFAVFSGAGEVCGASGGNPVVCVVALIVAIAFWIYEACIDNEFKENEYYIMQFTCESWQAPKQGDCEVCNDDVRPCSEYRCKSLGSKCHYFVENGEPGYCTTINEIWSAQITPWQEILTTGNKYTNIKNNGFKIEGQNSQAVDAWTSVTFGIVTDKPATCKIDFEHTEDYSEMKYEMTSSINPDTGKAEGTHHQIELNSYIKEKNESATTLGLSSGDNEYYIRCMNFAGQVNEAEFVVQVKVKDGPDLTPAELRRFEPATNSYLKQGANSTGLVLYLNEPAECRYSQEYDVVTGAEGYNELENEMICITEDSAAIYGEWTCFTTLQNLTEGENNFFFRCKDQPGLVETELYPRNTNWDSKDYTINICKEGLNISLLNSNTLIEESNFTLAVSTSGCLGDAVCSFRMPNYSTMFSTFFETGGKIHTQLLTLPQGEHEIEVLCEDEARNVANQTYSFKVYFDETPPQIVRAINNKGEITLQTDEPAECFSTTNTTIGCNIEFKGSIEYISQEHKFTSNPLETYFIKCRDIKLNTVQGCSAIIKPISIKQ